MEKVMRKEEKEAATLEEAKEPCSASTADREGTWRRCVRIGTSLRGATTAANRGIQRKSAGRRSEMSKEEEKENHGTEEEDATIDVMIDAMIAKVEEKEIVSDVLILLNKSRRRNL